MKQSSAERSAALSKNPLICCTINGHFKAAQMCCEKHIDFCDYWWWDWATEESVAPATVPQAGSAVRHLHMCSKECQGGGDWLIDFAEKEKTCHGEEVNCSVFFLFLIFAVSDEGVFLYLLWSCFTVSNRILQVWNWNKISILMTINSLQQLFFIAVTFLLI